MVEHARYSDVVQCLKDASFAPWQIWQEPWQDNDEYIWGTDLFPLLRGYARYPYCFDDYVLATRRSYPIPRQVSRYMSADEEDWWRIYNKCPKSYDLPVCEARTSRELVKAGAKRR